MTSAPERGGTGSGERATRVPVALPSGTVTVTAWHDGPDDAIDTVAIAHGAGAGPQHPFLSGFARALAARGMHTVRFAFPYQEAGRRMPGPPAHAVAAWAAVSAALVPHGRLWAAGKSYGGRMASMAAAEDAIDPAGLVYLGYPLHPPGAPERERSAHLPDVVAPQLFVSGTADPFVQPFARLEEVVASCRDAELHAVAGAGHSFEVAGARAPAAEIGAALAAPVEAWMRRVGAR